MKMNVQRGTVMHPKSWPNLVSVITVHKVGVLQGIKKIAWIIVRVHKYSHQMVYAQIVNNTIQLLLIAPAVNNHSVNLEKSSIG